MPIFLAGCSLADSRVSSARLCQSARVRAVPCHGVSGRHVRLLLPDRCARQDHSHRAQDVPRQRAHIPQLAVHVRDPGLRRIRARRLRQNQLPAGVPFRAPHAFSVRMCERSEEIGRVPMGMPVACFACFDRPILTAGPAANPAPPAVSPLRKELCWVVRHPLPPAPSSLSTSAGPRLVILGERGGARENLRRGALGISPTGYIHGSCQQAPRARDPPTPHPSLPAVR